MLRALALLTLGRRPLGWWTHRPHMTVLTMEAKLPSMMMMSDASCATDGGDQAHTRHSNFNYKTFMRTSD
jgi:hypothetical protein